jgi:hypothetical protein
MTETDFGLHLSANSAKWRDSASTRPSHHFLARFVFRWSIPGSSRQQRLKWFSIEGWLTF